jgi:hypothetical protein
VAGDAGGKGGAAVTSQIIDGSVYDTTMATFVVEVVSREYADGEYAGKFDFVWRLFRTAAGRFFFEVTAKNIGFMRLFKDSPPYIMPVDLKQVHEFFHNHGLKPDVFGLPAFERA